MITQLPGKLVIGEMLKSALAAAAATEQANTSCQLWRLAFLYQASLLAFVHQAVNMPASKHIVSALETFIFIPRAANMPTCPWDNNTNAILCRCHKAENTNYRTETTKSQPLLAFAAPSISI